VILCSLEADLVIFAFRAHRISRVTRRKSSGSPADQARIAFWLMSFLTAGEKEARAWTFRRVARAGCCRSDSFGHCTRLHPSEIVGYDALMRAGNIRGRQRTGINELEGRTTSCRKAGVNFSLMFSGTTLLISSFDRDSWCWSVTCDTYSLDFVKSILWRQEERLNSSNRLQRRLDELDLSEVD